MDWITKIKEDIRTFIRSCPTRDEWPNRVVAIVNGQVYQSEISNDRAIPVIHAEKLALESLRKHAEKDEEIVMYISQSPCRTCAEKILEFQDEHKVKFIIKFANVYYGQDRDNSIGLERLNLNRSITLHALQGNDWKAIIKQIAEFHGEGDWQNVLEKILRHEHLRAWKPCFRKIASNDDDDDDTRDWQTELSQIVEHNQSSPPLSTFLQAHGLHNLETELKLIVQTHIQEDWENTTGVLENHIEVEWRYWLKHTLKKNDLDHAEVAEIEKLVYQMDWENKLRENLQNHRKLHLFNVVMQLLLLSSNDKFRQVLRQLSPPDRKGYSWLMEVLHEFGIEEGNPEWLGKRIVADYTTAQELNTILTDKGRLFRNAANNIA